MEELHSQMRQYAKFSASCLLVLREESLVHLCETGNVYLVWQQCGLGASLVAQLVKNPPARWDTWD